MTTGIAEVLGTVAEIPTKRQAEQLLADRLRPINSGHYRPSSLRTLGDYAETIWLPQALPTLKYSTKRYYQYMLRVHLYPTFADVQLRSVPLGAKSVEILTARKPAGVYPDALVFSTDKGTPFDRRNLVNRQLKPTCKKIGLTGVGWHWLRHANATLLDAVGTP